MSNTIHAVYSEYEPVFYAENSLASGLLYQSDAENSLIVSFLIDEIVFPSNYSPQLDCSITVTVTVSGFLGSVSVSGTISGPCDELRDTVEAFVNDLIALGKDLYKQLK